MHQLERLICDALHLLSAYTYFKYLCHLFTQSHDPNRGGTPVKLSSQWQTEFAQASAGRWRRLLCAARGGTSPVVVRGWRAGELLSEQRMGRARDACGALLVLLMGRGGGSAVPPRLPIPSPHPICPALTGCELNNKSASVL